MIAQLVARRAKLIEELKRVEEALAIAKKVGSSVEIRTHRNIRNSPHLTTRTDWEGMVVVYADSDLTRVANSQDHGGWITGEDAAKLLADGYVDGSTIAFMEN